MSKPLDSLMGRYAGKCELCGAPFVAELNVKSNGEIIKPQALSAFCTNEHPDRVVELLDIAKHRFALSIWNEEVEEP